MSMRRRVAVGAPRAGAGPASPPANIGDVSVTERRRGSTGWPAAFPVAQAPNAPLLVALLGRGIAAANPRGRAHDVGRAVFALGFLVWAWEEATSGVNWFRRLLGVAGLLRIVGSAARRPRAPERAR